MTTIKIGSVYRARARHSLLGAVLVASGIAAHAGLVVGANINISRATGYQGETAIAMDPTNTQRLFAVSNNQSGQGAGLFGAYSTDGGTTWTTRLIATGADVTAACCDPSAQFDKYGNLFVSYVNGSVNAGVIVTSANGGQSFTTLATYAARDQPTIVTGPGTIAGQSSTWVSYQNSGGVQAARNLNVSGFGVFGALSAEQTAPGSSGGNFGDIVIGNGGKAVIAYQSPSGGIGPSTIFTNLDSNGTAAGGFGASRLASTTNVGGFAPIPAQSRRTIDSEAGLAYDTSGGPNNGRLYMVYTERASTASFDTNILLRHSDDDGANWSAPVKVNDDATAKSQFLPRISVDPVTGHVAIVWYDARNSASNVQAQLFGTMSLDGGLSFLTNALIGTGFSDASAQANVNEFGDYIGLTLYNDVFYAAWADNSNSTGNNPNGVLGFDMYTARVQFIRDSVGTVPEPTSLLLFATAAAMLIRQRRSAARQGIF